MNSFQRGNYTITMYVMNKNQYIFTVIFNVSTYHGYGKLNSSYHHKYFEASHKRWLEVDHISHEHILSHRYKASTQ